MRGKDRKKKGDVNMTRITPAYAGKSHAHGAANGKSWDHPRVCGEKRKEVERYAKTAGSPPRMRGKVNRYELTMAQARITPAYAGKSDIAPEDAQGG